MDEIYKNLDLNGIPNEIWKDIEGYENYQVSSYGRVKSLRDRYGNPREKILKQLIFKNGYLNVNLYNNSKMKTFRVHRLVSKAFIENPNNYTCVNHKDEDKTNNCVDNLEWCDAKYNINYGSRNAKVSKKVYQYTLECTLVSIWQSVNEVGRNGFHCGNVSSCCNNKFNRKGNNVYKGYIWSYTPIDSK